MNHFYLNFEGVNVNLYLNGMVCISYSNASHSCYPTNDTSTDETLLYKNRYSKLVLSGMYLLVSFPFFLDPHPQIQTQKKKIKSRTKAIS